MDLCNLTLHVELLGRMVAPNATLYFKAKWQGVHQVDAGHSWLVKKPSSPSSTGFVKRPGSKPPSSPQKAEKSPTGALRFDDRAYDLKC